MTIALDSSSSAYTEQVGSKTFAHTISAAANQVLVVGIENPNNADKVTGITFNGVALTRAYAYVYNSSSTYLYYLIAPAAGTHDIVVSFASNDVDAVIIAGSFSGVNQTSPVAATNGADAQGSGPTNVSIATPSGGVAVAMIGTGAQITDPFVPGTGQTAVAQLTNGASASVRGSMSYKVDATVMSSTWTQYRPWTASVLALAPAAVADTTPPTVTSASVANSTSSVVNLTMSENMDTGSVPAASAFTVSGHVVSSVAITGNQINLTMSAPFVNGEAARTVAYTQPGANNARDTATTPNLLANFSGQAITNNVAAPGDTTAPALSTAQVLNSAPTQIVLTFNETLGAFTPAAAAFAVSGGKSVTNVARNGATITVTCSAAYAYGDSISITYSKPGSNPIQDASNNQTSSFGPSAVTNNIAAPSGATFAASGTLKNLNGSIIPDGTYSVMVRNKAPTTGSTVAVKTGLAVASGICPGFTVAGPVAGTEYKMEVVNEADNNIVGLSRATPT